MTDIPIYKLVNRKWKELPTKGDDIGIKDPQIKVGYIGDLTKLSIVQLEELLWRQDKILNNKPFICKLNDKGDRLIARRKEISDALEMVRNNSIGPNNDCFNPESMSAYEWTGDLTGGCEKVRKHKFLNEDAGTNPLLLIASHSSDVPMHNSDKVSFEEDCSNDILKELKNLDIQDSARKLNEDSQILTNNTDFGSKTLNFMEQKEKTNPKKRASFKPFKLKKEWQPKPDSERNMKLWEESSATGYIGSSCNNKAKVIPLKESLSLLRTHQIKEKDRLRQEAVAHLSRIKGIKMVISQHDYASSKFTSYRDNNIERHILDDSDEEENDIHGNLKLVKAYEED